MRSCVLSEASGAATLSAVLPITLSPAKGLTHTVLRWLWVTPLEIEGDGSPTTASARTVPANRL